MNTFSETEPGFVLATLTETGTKPTKQLAVALDAWEAARPDLEPVDLDAECLTITADGVADLLYRATEREVIRREMLSTSTLTEVRDRLARRVSREFTTTAATVWAKYQTMFDDTAAQLTDTARKLPARLDLEHAAQHGTDTLAAWGATAELAATLDNLVPRFERLLSYVGWGRNLTPAQSLSRFVEFHDRDQYQALVDVPSVHQLRRWVGWSRIPGTRLRWASLDQLGQADTAANNETPDERADREQKERNAQRYLARERRAGIGL